MGKRNLMRDFSLSNIKPKVNASFLYIQEVLNNESNFYQTTITLDISARKVRLNSSSIWQKPNMELKIGVVLLVFDLLGVACLDSPSAKPLLTYDYQSDKFVLNETALRKLQTLQGPLRIISAIGDARVGKSTNLNLIRHFLDGNSNRRIQKVFKTSEYTEPCTTGVWMSVVRDTNNIGSTILIDTEGTNVGDNEITDSLSIFAVLLSSGLALFARERISNYNVQFLYRVSRFSEHIWEQDVQSAINPYPKLMVVLRDPLSPSPGNTLQNEIQDMILNDKRTYGQTIARLFPRDRIQVRDIPFVEDPKRLSDFEKFTRDDYAKIASSLAADFKRFPCKKTVHGGVVDGKMIADLAVKLQNAINRNSWRGLSNTYIVFETNLCDRRFQEIVEPILEKDVEEIKRSKDQAMELFVEKCTLREEINYTRDRIDSVIALKDEIREKQKRLEQEQRREQMEKKREIEREEERRLVVLERDRRLGEARRARKEAEEHRRILEEKVKRAEEAQRAEIAARRSRERDRRDIVRSILGGAVLFGIFSDSRLKENITALPHSEFEEIGLQLYSWVWSRKAAEDLGKTGTEHGVIAQEVEKLYPWAVVTGNDGYKRVYYAALEQLVMLKKKLCLADDHFH
ncbi:hypothetical protein OS493_010926 [Desmophyllum pertusum]|uniref:Peptidase S74 domain-containing protein n=1 Tax=Desmophyllum pertusum TaxID=174260 RepID=A0A9W9ZGT3_9CNID|nr:hypothetical protein OS493_010926 [Desmophyllum pertusum]